MRVAYWINIEKYFGLLDFPYEGVSSSLNESVNPQITFIKHVITEILRQKYGLNVVTQQMVNENIYRIQFYKTYGYLPSEYNCNVSSSSSSSSSISLSSSSFSFSSSSSRSSSFSLSSSSSSSFSHPEWGIYKVLIEIYADINCDGSVVSTNNDCVWIYNPIEYPLCYNGTKIAIINGPYPDTYDCIESSSSSGNEYAVVDNGDFVTDIGDFVIDI